MFPNLPDLLGLVNFIFKFFGEDFLVLFTRHFSLLMFNLPELLAVVNFYVKLFWRKFS